MSNPIEAPDGSIEYTASGVHSAESLAKMSGLDLSLYQIERYKPKFWDAQSKDGVIQLGSSTVSLTRVPQWVSTPVKLPKWKRKKPKRVDDANVSTVLVIPDTQNGYRRDESGVLHPMHSRSCWDLYVKAARILKPERVVLLGDMLDLAPWSTRWPVTPGLRDTTNPSLAELHWWLRQLRHALPDSSIDYIEGNHEHRIHKALNELMSEAAQLKIPGSKRPHMSIPTLLKLDALSVNYVGPFGADMWLWPDSDNPVHITHAGKLGAGGGQSVAKMLKDTEYSTIVGHKHSSEIAWKTMHGPQGKRERFAMIPGCGCELGMVPASTPRVDWQQGFGVIRMIDGEPWPELVRIHEGRMVLNGKVYQAGDPLPGIAEMFPEYRWA